MTQWGRLDAPSRDPVPANQPGTGCDENHHRRDGRLGGSAGPQPSTILAVPKVLLVTDADWVTEQCEAALSSDHRLHRVRRGADTLEAIELVDPDLVLLDMQVGNMGGMAACLAVRQEEDMGRLEPRPVIMLLDRDADEFLARHSAADGWLVKPIDPMRLARLVASTLADATAPA